jgi:hypothetical protein
MDRCAFSPGTHTSGVLSRDQIAQVAATVAAVDGPVNAGGVVAMRPLALHASAKAHDDRPRRVLHIEFAPAATLDDGAQRQVRGMVGHAEARLMRSRVS